MRRAQLEDELILGAEVDLLHVLPLRQIPEVQPPAVLAAEQEIGNEAVLEHVGGAPFARDRDVVAEVPEHVVREILRSAIDFPAPEHVERLVIHHEDAARTLALGVAERADVHAARAAVHGVRPRVSRALGDFLRGDSLDQLRLSRIRLRVDDVDVRRAQPGRDQVAPLDVRMRRVRTEMRAAGVPAEVVQLVAGAGHRDAPDDLAVGR